MMRKIIEIEKEKCNGCGICAEACHEGAIGIIDGKAQLLREDYCDGLGDCLPVCPTGAITFVEREAPAYDEAAVQQQKQANGAAAPLPCGCPGTQSRVLRGEPPAAAPPCASQLRQWPVQLKLVPIKAPYFEQADLLIAADCGAYAYGAFHTEFMQGRVTLIGCPKLDAVDYTEKLTEILRRNTVKSIRVVRMEVPCCGGLEHAVKTALERSGKRIPSQVVVLSTDGKILS